MVPPGDAEIGMHVIPVEKAIQLENKTTWYLEIFMKYGFQSTGTLKQYHELIEICYEKGIIW